MLYPLCFICYALSVLLYLICFICFAISALLNQFCFSCFLSFRTNIRTYAHTYWHCRFLSCYRSKKLIMMKRNFIAQIQNGLDLEQYTSLKPSPGPKLGTVTDTAHTHTHTHTGSCIDSQVNSFISLLNLNWKYL